MKEMEESSADDSLRYFAVKRIREMGQHAEVAVASWEGFFK